MSPTTVLSWAILLVSSGRTFRLRKHENHQLNVDVVSGAPGRWVKHEGDTAAHHRGDDHLQPREVHWRRGAKHSRADLPRLRAGHRRRWLDRRYRGGHPGPPRRENRLPATGKPGAERSAQYGATRRAWNA